MSVKMSVIHYSQTGTTYLLARAIEAGAREAGAEVRVRQVAELAPQAAIDSNPAWAAHRAETKDVPVATLDDLVWADAVVLGSPTRYGLPAAQLKQFIDTTGGLWAKGLLANKIASAFTSTATEHGGQESTILALNNTFYHWGAILVPPGYVDPIQFQSGNPYGSSFRSDNGHRKPDEVALASARFQGRRVAEIAARFLRGAAS